ncbi:MAG: HAMP domain-containing histidine kinase [Kiritimatiellae bacterium]|nr:HAMP domain-containing histidine kinase [Kiritimatiellia bacterium]
MPTTATPSLPGNRKKELRLFLLTTVLPTLLGLAAAAWSFRTSWQKMQLDERRDLQSRAEWFADALMSRVLASEGSPHAGPRGTRHPQPPRHLKENHPSSLSADEIAPFCGRLPRRDGTAFEIRNLDGSRFFASADWPARHRLEGECSLGPPLGDKTLATARADGGAGFRLRLALLFARNALITLLISSAFVGGGLHLLRTLRRERLDARTKADFFDNVSHELKTPLAGIRLNAELLVKNRIPDAELRRGALEAILVESDRLGRMVDELLEFRRLEKGTRRYRLETFDLAAFALDPAELQAAAAVSQGRVTVRAVGPSATVTADKDAIRQIGVILGSNALKYAGDGPFEIEIDGPCARYMDRGPGVPPGDEERIFERFWRGDDSLSAATSGSGLGLAIARGLARGMGGDLAYARRPGGGSVFTLHLQEAKP